MQQWKVFDVYVLGNRCSGNISAHKQVYLSVIDIIDRMQNCLSWRKWLGCLSQAQRQDFCLNAPGLTILNPFGFILPKESKMVALFICLKVQAIHIELANALSLSSCYSIIIIRANGAILSYEPNRTCTHKPSFRFLSTAAKRSDVERQLTAYPQFSVKSSFESVTIVTENSWRITSKRFAVVPW